VSVSKCKNEITNHNQTVWCNEQMYQELICAELMKESFANSNKFKKTQFSWDSDQLDVGYESASY